MTILTQQYIDDHCVNLNIPRIDLSESTIPDGVTKIGYCAFLRCTSLSSITIPDSVTEIGIHVFSCIAPLQSITIPHNVTKIVRVHSEYADPYNPSSFLMVSLRLVMMLFRGCSALTSITIPDGSVTEIHSRAFMDCTPCSLPSPFLIMLQRLVFDAFRGCTSLTSITIPDSVTHIGGKCF